MTQPAALRRAGGVCRLSPTGHASVALAMAEVHADVGVAGGDGVAGYAVDGTFP